MAERDIVDVLLEDHREVRSLFKQTADATGDARKELFDVIRATLVRHEVAEEMIVRPVSRSIGIDSVADERVEEESKAEEMLKELEGLDPSSREFAVKFEALHTAVEEHAEAEEREEFPALRQSVDPDRLRTMATIFERAKQLAPTHPHPSTPNTATANVLVGPFAAIADRARDAVRAAMG